MHKEKNTFYINITSVFSGIGYIILDINSVILDAVSKYSLDITSVPSQTIYLHYQYIVQNLKKYQLKDIIFFYENTGNLYFDFLISVLIKQAKNEDDISEDVAHSYKVISHSIETKRIAMVLSCSERDLLNTFFLNSGIYVGLIDDIAFEIPYAFTLIYKPLDKIDPTKKYEFEKYELEKDEFKKYELNYSNEKISNIKELINEKRMNDDFFDFSVNLKNVCIKVDENIIYALLQHKSKIFFDGRIYALHNGYKNVEDADELEIDNLKKELFCRTSNKKWNGKDLQLLMPAETEGISFKHLANIRKSAMSLYDGKFHYSSIVKDSSQVKVKQSAKMLKIIKTNEEAMQKEQRKADDIWLRNFFGTYSKIGNLKEKKILLENTKTSSPYIKRKLFLLKVELYSDIWNLEKRSENIDERALVPLYLAILEYIEEYTTLKQIQSGEIEIKNKKKGSCKHKEEDLNDEDELEFVLSELIKAGFEATARELLSKLNIQIELPFSTSATAAPNDIDLYFQLKYVGDHLKRTLGTRKDNRVPFDPDKWQVQLLDLVDSNKSAVVSAPTSSGKTFICFYAIEKILKSSDTDIVIFCLPTKALVNQVSADIYARFNPKNIKVSLQGTLMPDKCNDTFNCQVLITIPSLLESLLNSGDVDGKLDRSRIKYIIMDEIHKINDVSLGSKIERIIHLAPCPMLLLSATLGNLDNFYSWIKNIEKSKGRECELVVHTERYCELKTFVYSTNCLSHKDTIDDISAIDNRKLVPLNNMFAYSFDHLKKFGFSNDLHFLPDELLNIYYYIYMALDSSQKKLIKNLAPKKFFKSNIISKADVKGYQKHLLSTFEGWVQQSILSEHQVKEVYDLLTKDAVDAFPTDLSEQYILDNILDLLNQLKNENMAPIIVFNTDREFVTRLAKHVYQQLEDSDIKKKKDKLLEKRKKEIKRTRDAEKTKDSWIEDSIAMEQNIEPEQRDINYTFLDPITKLTDYDIKEEFHDVRNVPKDILDMAYRGIGIHHDALNRKYRGAVEILFRKKHIRVLFATETLALGINMPCRTTVFAGDSLYLDPMNYKQMSGRAGRRGYDTLGNVVFFGIPKMRVQNLMVSSLPEIKGAYTYSNTSLTAFSIEESILKYPLLSANCTISNHVGNVDTLTDEMAKLTTESPVPCTLNLFENIESRKSLVEKQKLNYPFLYPSNHLWDLYISNREFDPSIFVFSLLLESNIISWEPLEFVNTIAHLFQVVPVHSSFDYKLPSLPPNTEDFLNKLNKVYAVDAMDLSPLPLKNLQKYTEKPLHYIKSFLYTYQTPKNSYILDFYKHGSPVKIFRNNLISDGELWASLYYIDLFIKSLINLLENSLSEDATMGNKLKKLKIIYEELNSKFKKIFV